MSQLSFFENEPVEHHNVKRLNEPSLPPWELDDLKNRKVAKIVFPTGFDAVLDYLIPPPLTQKIEKGMRLMVPLGKSNRPVPAYCIDVVLFHSAEQNVRLKNVLSVIDERRLLDDTMLELTQWIADYYLCPLGQVLEAVLPAGVRSQAGTRLTTVLLPAPDVDQKLAILKQKQEADKLQLLTAKQIHVLEILRQSSEPLTSFELQKAAKCSATPIMTLKRLTIIVTKNVRRAERSRSSTEEPSADRSPHSAAEFQLNPDQRRVLSLICSAVQDRKHATFLLHGVTGSGKTEVYIQAIQEVVRRKKQAIVLVPEISLTPQTVGRFQSRFERVAILHSHLTDAERHRQWMSIINGDVQVVVGARSAIFAPLPKLGLIVIDEEHENSFKQDTAPRYHARSVAQKRAELLNIPLILGSATPSLESWHRTQEEEPISVSDSVTKKEDSFSGSRFRLLTMPSRVRNLRLPEVQIVDLREEVRNRRTRGAVHRQLHQAIYETLQHKGQVILLLNRRGFSTHIQCPSCSEVVKCPSCDIALTHYREEIALCHYCDYQIPSPAKCPKCGFLGINYTGFGTQKLEMEIRSRFPDASVLRMDSGTMQGPGAHERALTKFRSGQVDILLGTQMIAKGLDFPNVTLVGVINADTSLHLPDFRAAERTFHLITQVAGRTGRGDRGGRVIIQTFSPDHSAIIAASRHDYEGFVKEELPMRKLLGYPPYSSMVRIVIRGEDEAKTFEFAQEFARRLPQRSENHSDRSAAIRVLGPAPAPVVKLRNFYRFHIQLHCQDAERLHIAVEGITQSIKTPNDVQWVVDVDPVDML